MRMNETQQLLGPWRTDPSDAWSLREYGDVSLHFSEKGKLTYKVHLANKEQIMHLRYRVERTTLITDQPSAPHEERTEFLFTPDGRLAVRNASLAPPTYYVRQG